MWEEEDEDLFLQNLPAIERMEGEVEALKIEISAAEVSYTLYYRLLCHASLI